MISVIIPIFNAAVFLRNCLTSLLAQQEKDWEAILVNDGSSDESAVICEEFVSTDKRFQYFSQTNSGVSSARNLGIQHAKGEWICFLDADDSLPSDSLSTLLEAMKTSHADLVIGGYEIWDQNGKVLYQIDDRVSEELDRDGAIALMYKSKYYSYLGYICGKMFRSDILHNLNLSFNPKIYFNEDRLFVTQYLAACNRVLLLTQPVYHYVEHPGSATASRQQGFNENYVTDLEAMILMRETIARFSPKNFKNATEGIACSYWQIQYWMNKFHANSFNKVFALHKKVFKQLKLKEYCRLIVLPFFQKIPKKLFRRNNSADVSL